jgi:hypothetical protein
MTTQLPDCTQARGRLEAVVTLSRGRAPAPIPTPTTHRQFTVSIQTKSGVVTRSTIEDRLLKPFILRREEHDKQSL